MTQRCESCRMWTAPKGDGPYGLCKPTELVLPFWAVRHQTDMQTQTHRKEGEHCESFLPRGAA